MEQTAVEWFFEKVMITHPDNLDELLEQAKEMEEKQRQEDKLTGMKEANELLDELIEKNMCSNSGDILIKQFKKRINL